jgi:nicotinamide mononucleotide transporter
MIYVVMQVYGWYHWLHGGNNDQELKVSSQSAQQMAFWIAMTAIGAVSWGHFMATQTDAAAPYADAFVVVTSLIAQWLMARKKIESWFFWITVDVVAIGVYLYKSLYVTTGLYTVFLFMAISGYFVWRKSLLQNVIVEPVV